MIEGGSRPLFQPWGAFHGALGGIIRIGRGATRACANQRQPSQHAANLLCRLHETSKRTLIAFHDISLLPVRHDISAMLRLGSTFVTRHLGD